jgi:hypothetical protein
MQAGFVKLRRGILEHIPDRMSVHEFGVFTVLLTLADFRNATWIGSGTELRKYIRKRKKTVHELLFSLRSKGYIKFDLPKGNNSKYPIFIPKYYTDQDGNSLPNMTIWEPANTPNGNQQMAQNSQTGTSKTEQPFKNERHEPPEEVNLKKKVKSPPYPPPGGTEIFFEWARKTIAVRMGRKKRLPNLDAYQGGMAWDVVEFLHRKGFQARIVTVQ